MRPTKRKTDGAGSLQGPEAGCPEHLPRSMRVSLPGGLNPQAPPPPHPEMALALGVYNLEKSTVPLDTLEALTRRTSLVLGGHQYELEEPEEDEGQTAVLSRSDMLHGLSGCVGSACASVEAAARRDGGRRPGDAAATALRAQRREHG